MTTPPSAVTRSRLAILAWVLGIGVASVLVSLSLWDVITAFPQGFLEDDAYFYAKIAYHLGTTHQSTFDGIHTTDGYHLLWGGLLGLVCQITALFTLDRETHLVVMLSVFLTLGLSAARFLGRTWGERAVYAALLLVCTFLMETLLAAILLLVVSREWIGGRARLSWASLLAVALVPLARVDLSVVALAIVAGLFAERRYREGGLLLGALAAGLVAQLGAVAALSGELTTVSSQIKAERAFAWASNLRSNLGNARGALALAVGGFALGGAWWTLEGARRRRFLVLGGAVTAFAGAHLLASPATRTWYFLPTLWIAAWLIFSLGRRRSALALQAVVGALFLVFVAQKVVHHRRLGPEMANSRRFVGEVRRLVPPNAPVFQLDASGYVGFFSGRRVVNGDGLANTHAYLRARRARRLGSYLSRQHIRYVVTNTAPDPTWVVRFGGIALRRRDVVTLIPPFASRHPHAHFALYRLR